MGGKDEILNAEVVSIFRLPYIMLTRLRSVLEDICLRMVSATICGTTRRADMVLRF